MLKLPNPPLLLVTDRRQARRPLEEIVAAALAAGCRWVSVREKDLQPGEQILLAGKLLPLARRHGATLMLHGDATVARSADCDGVHLRAGADAAAARMALGAEKLVGVSVHTVAKATAIDPAVVDYALAGPAYETASKPGYGPALGRQGFGEIARASRVPVLAIGGIDAGRIGELVDAGASGVAVMGGVMRAADVEREVRALIAALTRAQPIRARDRC